jgi:beta-carotene 3-hydroxylase
MSPLIHAAIALATVLLMEAWAWLMHRYLLHGPLWFLHRSHHEPRSGWWEWNDLVSLAYGAASAALVIYGIQHQSYTLGIGIGIAVYGVLYFWLHDIIIHRRIKLKYQFRSRYINRLIRAHKLHHKHLGRAPGEAYGFLYAAPKYEVRRSGAEASVKES